MEHKAATAGARRARSIPSRWFAAGRRSPSTGRGAKQSEAQDKGHTGQAKHAERQRLLVLEHAVRDAAAAAPLLELGSQLHLSAKEQCQNDVQQVSRKWRSIGFR